MFTYFFGPARHDGHHGPRVLDLCVVMAKAAVNLSLRADLQDRLERWRSQIHLIGRVALARAHTYWG